MNVGCFIFIAFVCKLADGYNSYLVVSPDTIRPGMDFAVQYTKLDNTMPDMTLRVTIYTKEDKNVASETTRISEGTRNANILLRLPMDLPTQQYYMEVKGRSEGRELFVNSTSLTYMDKGMSIFVQTDKAIYKPGQKVQFRVLGTRSDLSIVVKPMNIFIHDPNNNKIAQWLDVEGTDGVFQGEMQLSDQPPLGDWKIEVDYLAASSSKTFTVAEYVLPKFEVKITVPKFGVVTDKYLSGTVTAKYTFGKGVEGNGTLKIRAKSYYRKEETLFSLSYKINGIYKFEIEVKQLEELFGRLSYKTFELIAEVEEGLTGNTLNGTSEIQYYDREEKMVFMDGADNFKPGLPYTAYMFISDQDGKPLSSASSQVNITVTMYYETKKEELPTTLPVPKPIPLEPIEPKEDEKMVIPRWPIWTPPPPEESHILGPETINVPRNGIVPFTFTIPIHIKRVVIKAEFKELQQTKSLEKFHSTSNTFIQISVLSRKPKTGRRANFKIRTTEANVKVNYMIQSKGQIVESGLTRVRRKSKTIRVRMTADMAPSAKIVVYYVRLDAEIIADSVQFNVKGVFENEVDVDHVSQSRERPLKRTNPGKKIKVKVTADPGSTCHVLAVDMSVLLLKTGNDIDPGQVEQELESYDRAQPSPCTFFPCLRSYYPLPVGGVDVTSIFQNSGLTVLTDAFLYQWQRPFMPIMMEMEMMPMAAAAEDGVVLRKSGDAGKETTRVRTLFPETWIYESAKADENGTAIIKTTVPDTITSWITSAFAVHKRSGLGVALDTAKLEVFLKFFIRLDLPYSVIRGEQVILLANVFNFFDSDLEVDAVLLKSSAFQNIVIQQLPNRKANLVFRHDRVTRTVKIPAGSGVAIKFPIKAVELGNIDISVRARSGKAGDAVRKQLLVEPEGIAEEYGIPILVDLKDTSSFEDEKSIALPDDIVKGSVKIRISVIGDLMGPSISGITNLLRMPYGCGEQNMITFVPNIYAIQYLESINNLKPVDLSQAEGYMMVGYQKELTYQHFDGSFSAFGNSDPSGSTWLTAFVVKSFAEASPYIYIDPAIVRKAIDWLLNQFNEKTMTFREPGHVIHKEMQGGSATSEHNLAAYVLIALLEAKEANFSANANGQLASVIDDGTLSLENAVDDMDEPFELAITGYALVLANSNKVGEVLSKLDAIAIEQGGMKYWDVNTEPEEPNTMRYIPHQARSNSIETTAYVLLIHAVRTDIHDGLKTIKWLVRQRNPTGGFGSTQDTVVALQALSSFAGLIYADGVDMHITITSLPSLQEQIFTINTNNALLLQAAKLDEGTTTVKIEASGSGMALAQVTVDYNVMSDPITPKFQLRLSFTDETISGFKLRACFKWLGKGTSGMAVMEVGLLSGFMADKFTVTNLSILKQVEDGLRSLNLYFQEIPSDEMTCFSVKMQREGLVVGSQPAVVKLYDYYEPENQITSMYQPDVLRDSDVCDLDGGELGCGK